ncbi:cadherin repeat domain-containing protein, partial [Candidatus Poribacteria bacterium]|nr:cadherin repeat domain-containing protein [Candidatus Poribacteria bacterium]
NTAPVFTEGDSATRSIAENTGSGVDIGDAVSATDSDEDTLTYSLGGTDASSFSIDSTSGQLRTDAALDYETKSSYSVTITVSDGNEGSDSIAITINITDVDEVVNSAPVFTDGDSVTRSIAENTGSGVDIGTAVSATDVDEDTLTYSLGGTDGSSFGVDSSSGQLRTSAALDYETKTSYSVTLTVSDGKGGSDSIAITINIVDVDETENSAPVFTDGSSTSRSIAENTGSGVDIGSAVSATDADDDTLSYSLGGTDISSFSIDSSSGQLRTSAALDYETKSSYSVTVSVSDGAGGSDSITVTINVTDVDESPVNIAPVFADGSSTTRSVAENTVSNSNIGSAVAATDDDDDTISYSLSGTDASSFSIDSASGQLKTNASLNFEVKNSYAVTITASDGQGGSASISVTINITNVNEAPVFTDGASTTRSIVENASAGINIGSVVAATDVDSTTLTYTLGGTDVASFDIESTTGQLKTKAALDYETKTSYSVTIGVSDGALTDSIAVTINVSDLDETPSNIAPVFTDGDETTRSIAENSAANTNIGTAIAATDEDSETLAYLLSGTDASSFSIDGSSGQLKTSAALNYEDKTSYSVTVTVSDGSLEDEIAVTINVTNVNEAPVFAPDAISRSVAENTAAGTNLGSAITATDPDAGDSITYSIGGTDAASFDIVSTSGQLQTKASLDYETKTSYSISVIATDSDDATDTIPVTISVTNVNEAPAFANETTTRSVNENTGSGVNIGDAVSATDPDTDDTLEYSLGGTDAASFDIGSTNGQLRTKAALDYETKTSYSVTVSVSDGNGGKDSIAVTINVNDVHENTAPSFASDSTTRSVAENTGSGVNIGDAVSATDPDTDDTLEYTLSGTDASSFDIGSTNGQLRTKAALDYETKTSYSVTVSVSDGKGGTDSITVTINVTDVAENRAPAFASDSTTRSVAENTGSGVNIGTAV